MAAWDEAGWAARAWEAAARIGLDGGQVVVDHFGVAVWTIKGVQGEIETIGHEGVRVVMVGMVELMEAMGAETAVGRFLARRGEGLHHVGLRVTGLESVCDRLSERGVRLVGDGVRVGARGRRYRFVHPESTGGLLLEMVEVAA